MTIEQRIRAAVDEVVAATDPDQVVVFGSAAKGTARPDSDIDLLVICDPARHDGGMRTCAATWRRLEAPARAVVAHAERTVPGLVERTKARIAEE